MTWRKLNADEVALFDNEDLKDEADGVLWSRSPCGVPIVTWGPCLDHSLIVLHELGFHDAVRDVITRPEVDFIDPLLADFFAGYRMMTCLAHVLERSCEACAYVISLPDVADEEKNGHIAQARHLARAARAKHAASDALESLK